MIREPRIPRPDLRKKVEHLGLSFHTLDGKPYWNESAAYRFEAHEIDEIEVATNELHRMCLEAVDRITDSRDYDRFGILPRVRKAIEESWRSGAPGLYGRFDLAYDGQSPPKLLEYNADTPTSLLEAAVIQWHWLQDLDPEADQFNSIWEALIGRWRDLKEGGWLKSKLVHFGCVDCPEDFMTVAVLMDTAVEAELEVLGLNMNEIGWDHQFGRFVDQSNEPIKTLFKLYPWEWALKDEFGPKALRSLGDVLWLEPIWKMLLSNKAILSALWEMFPDHPNLLPAYMDGPRNMKEYVRKPTLGREGANVSVIRGADSLEIGGPYFEGSFVYQAYEPLPVFDGNHAVVGSWVIGSTACGIGIRESDGPITQDQARFVPHYFYPSPAPAEDSKIIRNMNVQVVQIPPIHVAMIRHTGPYEEIGPVFDRLWDWVTANGVPAGRIIGIYFDNPDFVAASRLRSCACVEIQEGYHISSPGGLPLESSHIPGGEYATTRYVGPYEEMAPVWSGFTRYIERDLRRTIGANPAFEVYVNDASTTPPDQLITDMYMPVQ